MHSLLYLRISILILVFSARENALTLPPDVLPAVDSCAWSILSDVFYDVCASLRGRVVQHTRARSLQVFGKKQRNTSAQCSRDEEKDSALRPRAAKVWNDRETAKGQEEGEEEIDRTKRKVSERISARRELSERRYANV